MLRHARTNADEVSDFRQVFAELPTPVALVSISNGEPWIVAASAGFAEQLGLTRAAIEGRRVSQVFRVGAAQVRLAITRSVDLASAQETRITYAFGDRVVRLEIGARPLTAGVLLSVRLLAERPTLAEVGEAAVLDEIAPLLGGLVFIRDLGSRSIRYGRHPLGAQLDLPSEPLDLRALDERVHPADRAAYRRHLRAEPLLGDTDVSEVLLRLKAGGQWLWFAVRTRVLNRDAAGAVRRVIGVARDVTHNRETAEALASSSLALAHAELNERRRVGRELHDSTSQQLVAARLGLSALERHVTLKGEPGRIVSAVRRAISAAQKEIRNLSYVLHPPSLEDGLRRALEDFGAGFGLRAGLQVSVSVEASVPRLPEALEMALFRVAQESLMNVYRHARARHAAIRLRLEDGAVILEIEDDGIGLSRRAAGQSPTPIGVGISGMRARMTQLGGSLVLESRPTGLTIRASVPLRAP
jgi:signal transduction histidine kinase